MNVTTNSIYKEIVRLSTIEKKKFNQLQNNAQIQFNDEVKLIETGSACRKSTLDRISFNINNLDEFKLKTEIDKRFFSPAVMITAMCVTDSTFYVPNNSLGTLLKLKKWIHNLKRIGVESSEGIAVKADLGPVEGMFILKSAQDAKFESYVIIHEMMVGMYGTNILRGLVPNFAYIYGGFSCAPPIIDDNKNVVSWCVGTEPTSYIIYENIQPSVAWKEYIETALKEEFLSAYLQILYALAEAVKQIDFTHYDLHWNNILMRDYIGTPSFQIKYNTENGVEYLTTNKVSTIIDYGLSHIAYKGKHYGSYGRLGVSVYPDRSHSFFDAYKLLMFSMYEAWTSKNDDVLNEAIEIYKFFSQTEDPFKAIKNQWQYRYSLPLHFTKNKNLFELTTYIRKVCDCSFITSEPSNVPILSCIEGCPSVKSIFKDIGLQTENKHTTTSIFDFYEIYKATGEKVDIDYEVVKDNFVTQLSEEYDEMFNDLKNVKMIDLTAINEIDETAIYIYTEFLYQLVNLLDRYNTYLLELFIGQEVIDMYEKDVDFSDFISLDGQFDKLVDIVNNNNKILLNRNPYTIPELTKHFDVAKRILEIHNVIKRE